jgi:hypothetical protein
LSDVVDVVDVGAVGDATTLYRTVPTEETMVVAPNDTRVNARTNRGVGITLTEDHTSADSQTEIEPRAVVHHADEQGHRLADGENQVDADGRDPL